MDKGKSSLDTADQNGTTIKKELESLARDCEELHIDPYIDCAERRSWMSVVHRIRHAAQRLGNEQQSLGVPQ